ncbi:hypothetical protein C5167_001092 [Papaver somniferum]|uniref:Protein kinase domain-containing protein n=1 Tax=Papaver somniferum TaxID=3469 RepID=A0A4Y7KY95_PAPSO|nr:hypothetical protein C5167_001092 [Papaver somniferum]
MLYKTSGFSRLTQMGCCSCFGFTKKTRKLKPFSVAASLCSQEFLLNGNLEDSDTDLYNGIHGSYGVLPSTAKASENILSRRAQNGMICRGVPVKETHQLIRSEAIDKSTLSLVMGYHVGSVHNGLSIDENGDKMVNEYVRVCKIGSGSYGKVVLYRSISDGKQYAIKAFHKSHLLKLRVAPSETAMTDVLREDSDPPKGLDETTARRYLRGIVAGVMYLHSHNVIHGDIKPDNLLITSSGAVKIGDFSVSQVFEVMFLLYDYFSLTFTVIYYVSVLCVAKSQQAMSRMFGSAKLEEYCSEKLTLQLASICDGKDELRRSPGTPVFTAPECCSGVSYHGKASDTWAVGVTLYCMILGRYPFLGETLQDTYDKHPQLMLIHFSITDPNERITLEAVAHHPWVIQEEGLIPEYVCLCKRRKFSKGSSGF